MQRSIYLGDPKFRPIPNENLNAWLIANSLDPKEISIDSVATINGDFLTVTVFIFNEDGTRLLNMGGSAGYLKELRTVPMLSAPEDHNL